MLEYYFEKYYYWSTIIRVYYCIAVFETAVQLYITHGLYTRPLEFDFNQSNIRSRFSTSITRARKKNRRARILLRDMDIVQNFQATYLLEALQ